MSEAIRILRREHASMNKVLAVLAAEMKVYEELGQLDLELLLTILDYIQSFPDEAHHPKEERFIFEPLRARAPEAGALIDELEREHRDEAGYLAGLRERIEAFSLEVPVDRAEFQQAVRSYIAFIQRHMRKEEEVLFPLAEKALTAEDWAAVEAALADNADPLSAPEAGERYRELMRRIIYLSLPPPGPPRPGSPPKG